MAQRFRIWQEGIIELTVIAQKYRYRVARERHFGDTASPNLEDRSIIDSQNTLPVEVEAVFAFPS